MYIDARYYTGNATPVWDRYASGQSSLQLFAENGEPLFTATVNIPHRHPASGCIWIKGWSENEGLPEALEAAGVVTLTGVKCPCGFVEAQEGMLVRRK